MTVNPGFGGQRFIGAMMEKIAQARRLIDERAPQVLLEVDGGVTTENVSAIIAHGAEVIVAGYTIFSSNDYGHTISALRRAP